MLQKLLDSGLDITFSLARGHRAGRYDCFVLEADGDTVVGSGNTPAAALAAASATPEAEATVHLAAMRPAPDCVCEHWEAGHFDREDGRRPCGYAGCRCTAYRAAPAELATVAADGNGEHPGDVEAAAGSLPWTMDEDGSRWRAVLPDGRTAVIERLGGAHMCPCGHRAAEHSNIESGECLADGCGCVRLAEFGPSFLPRVYESRTDFAVGPVCAGLLGAGAWVAQYAGAGTAPCSLCQLRAARGIEPPPGGCTCQAGQLERASDAR